VVGVSDVEAQATADETPDQSADAGEPADESSGPSKRNVFAYLQWAGLVLCSLLVVVAGLRVYWGVGAFISLWVAPRFEPLVTAGFNLAVLLVAAYGVALLSRRLTATG
jgi:hypothetical protein